MTDPMCDCGHERSAHWTYGVQKGRCEFCRCLGYPGTLPDSVFDEARARWDAADDHGTREKVARAICGARSEIPWDAQAGWQQRHYRRMADAALDALKTSGRQQEEA